MQFYELGRLVIGLSSSVKETLIRLPNFKICCIKNKTWILTNFKKVKFAYISQN